jgi:predicted nucleic acid-binding protein
VNLYVDASVLLRLVLGERGALREWRRSDRLISSERIRLECLRTLDRSRLLGGLSDEVVAGKRAEVLETLHAFELLAIDRLVLELAAAQFPTALGTLDAIHLASALVARDEVPDLVLATHDRELAVAGRSAGFDVVGSLGLA